jgi:hypothetical protein
MLWQRCKWLCGVLFPDSAREDKVDWKANANGEFQVRGGQELHRCMNPLIT